MFKSIIKIIANIFTCILFAILILIIIGKMQMLLQNKKYPNYFGYTLFEVASGSMEPTLYVNDVILVKITKDNIKKNDIIAFSNNNAIVTHRVIFVENNVITVKGDANNAIDSPITFEEVIGKVVKVYPKLGVWKKVIAEPKILITIFITFLLFDFALSYNDKSKKNEKTKIDKDNNEIKINKIEYNTHSNDLLELTRKIDISEINELLDNEYKLNKKEIKELENKVVNIKEEKKVELTDKEKEFVDYTVRLDLEEIMKNIDKKLE